MACSTSIIRNICIRSLRVINLSRGGIISFVRNHFPMYNLVENYRPINIIPVISRIMENMVQNQLPDHLLKEDIIDPSQLGFIREGHVVHD